MLLAEREELVASGAKIAADRDLLEESRSRGESRVEALDAGDSLSVEMATLKTISSGVADRVSEIDHALERIQAGSYGDCAACGGEISLERLVARPRSTTCVVCASRPRR